ncbi:MAG: VOC family protein [Candidatus Methylomirabilis sp.]
MAKRAKAIPEGYHTITPHLTVRGAAQAIEFYKRAFGAKVRMRMPGPDGKTIMHAELKIGDSIVFLNDEFPDMGCRSPQSLGGTASGLFLYVRNVDAAFNRAVAAGAKVQMPVSDMFWGDRYGKVIDPLGHEWGIGTHKEDLTPSQIRKRGEAFFAQMPKKK